MAGKKTRRLLTRLCLWIVICVLLSTVITVGLVCLDVVDIPVVDTVVRKVELLFHREHEWMEATCVDPETCEICGEIRGEPKGHDWQDATSLKPRYCPVCEQTEGEPLGHSGSPATCDLPQPTLKIAVVSSTGKLKLSWNKVEGATEYEVYRSTDGGKTYKLLKTTTGTSLTNTSITAGNKYYYKVKAIHSNSGASSAFSSVVSGTCDLPRPELKISVVASTGKLKLSWNKVEGASKYELYRSTDGGKTYKLLKTTTGTSVTNSSATAGNKYYYKVKAIHSNSNANSAFSSAKYGTCDLARPNATVKLNSSGKPVVSWEAVEGAVEYTVYIYNADGELVKTASTTSLKLTHSSAVKGNTYSYRVVAVHSNTNANSAKSIAVSIKSK